MKHCRENFKRITPMYGYRLTRSLFHRLVHKRSADGASAYTVLAYCWMGDRGVDRGEGYAVNKSESG